MTPTWKTRLAQVFVNPEEGRLRAGWRLLAFVLLFGALQLLTGVALSLVLRQGFPAWLNALTVGEALTALPLTASVVLARRWFDRRSFASLGLTWDRRAGHDLLFGVGLTGLLMGLIFLAEGAFGWLHLRGFAWDTMTAGQVLGMLANALLLWVLVAWNEELLFRGYLLTNLRDGMGTTWAVVLSSLLFAAAHVGNPHMGWPALLGLVLAGFFLADGWLTTGRLWLPLGLHLGWNLFEGTVFGFPVSGLTLPPLLVTDIHGPDLVTGGAFGPEAGLIIVPALALGTWLMHRRARRGRSAAA
ncbi:MAG TPA: CPBP family intramembrane metalloprotease [Anaerolineae bacterium]|nr:CPBP family intramembrane metalloprotease [Anaerolineae bacterium]HID85277.1 CPBP family intramembrane metalloprotease [Anaerolineales bacterium]HIQ09758.1 CPBP family intramembrane metalloprotease [Anaerolineaceae bacterium]